MTKGGCDDIRFKKIFFYLCFFIVKYLCRYQRLLSDNPQNRRKNVPPSLGDFIFKVLWST